MLLSSTQPRRAICVTRDPEIARVVETALRSVGLGVEHHQVPPISIASLADPDGVVCLVVDRDVRCAFGVDLAELEVPIVVVGDDLADDDLVDLMLDAPISHVVADPADRHVQIATAKLATGDYFGLEKYLTAEHHPVRERAVADDDARRHAVGEVCAWAEAIGARRPAVHRIANVVDELLMNALREGPAAVLRFGHDGETLAISVGDPRGALDQRDVIANVRRARRNRGAPRASQPIVPSGPSLADATPVSQGAGLGLYLVMANVASLIVNVERGRRTEVVCLFDRAGRMRAAVTPPRALHVFAS